MKRSNLVERFCGHTTGNASRLGYTRDYNNTVITCTWRLMTVEKWSSSNYPHTHSLTDSLYFLSLNFHLSINTSSSGKWNFQLPPLCQHKFKWRVESGSSNFLFSVNTNSSGEWTFQISLNREPQSQTCHCEFSSTQWGYKSAPVRKASLATSVDFAW